MRWVIFFTVQAGALTAGAASVIHGPSVWTAAPVGGTIWLLHRLFNGPPGKAQAWRDGPAERAEAPDPNTR